jgi:excisionase family DNA binding protein
MTKQEPIVDRFERLYEKNADNIKSQMTPRQRFLGVKDLAEYLGVPINTLRSWVWMRKIPYIKLGRIVKFDLRDIDEWIRERKVEPFK